MAEQGSSSHANAAPIQFGNRRFFDVLLNCAPGKTNLHRRPSEESVLTFENDEVYNVQTDWSYCLLGLFAGKFPRIKVVQRIMETWKAKCVSSPILQGGWYSSLSPTMTVCVFSTDVHKMHLEGPFFSKPLCPGSPSMIWRSHTFQRGSASRASYSNVGTRML